MHETPKERGQGSDLSAIDRAAFNLTLMHNRTEQSALDLIIRCCKGLDSWTEPLPRVYTVLEWKASLQLGTAGLS